MHIKTSCFTESEKRDLFARMREEIPSVSDQQLDCLLKSILCYLNACTRENIKFVMPTGTAVEDEFNDLKYILTELRLLDFDMFFTESSGYMHAIDDCDLCCPNPLLSMLQGYRGNEDDALPANSSTFVQRTLAVKTDISPSGRKTATVVRRLDGFSPAMKKELFRCDSAQEPIVLHRFR